MAAALALALAPLLAAFGVVRPLPPAAWVGLLLGLPAALLWGLLLGALGVSLSGRSRAVRWLLGGVGLLCWLLLIGLRVGQVRHLAALGRLPPIDVFERLRDLEGLDASLRVHAPLGRVALEWLLPVVGSVALARWWRRRPPCPPRFARRSPWILGLLGLLGLLAPWSLEGAGRLAALDPLLHWALSARDRRTVAPARPPEAPPPFDLVARVQGALGTVPLEPPGDARYPLCAGTRDVPPETVRRRRLLLLLLEGVGLEALHMRRPDGSPLMPALREAAERGVNFERFFVPGDSSAQTLVSLLSGLSPPPFRRVLRHAPLVRLPSVAADLRAAGFRTAYFHGSDLSFEQQRLYLRRSGFETIWEPDPSAERIGWGVPDGELFDRFIQWIAEQGEEPLFAVLATVGSHDPYALPPDAERPFVPKSGWDRYRNTLAELDRHLGRFLAWVRRHEPPDTLVLLLGDHPPRVTPEGRAQRSDGRHLRFRVPLVLLGLGEDERVAAREAARGGPSGPLDLPRTLLGAVGWPRVGCYQGRDLLRDPPVAGRLLVSLVGEGLQWMVLRTAERRWTLHLPSRRLWVRPLGAAPRADALLDGEAAAPVRQFARDYLALGAWLQFGDHFVPPAASLVARRRSPPPLTEPLLVAHRGNLRGPGGLPGKPENSLALLRAAADAGVPWVELDVQVTADGHAVLLHDGQVTIDGSLRPVHRLSLQALREAVGRPVATLQQVVDALGGRIGLAVELKPQPTVFAQMDLLRAAFRALRRLPPGAPLLVDSFSRTTLRSLLTHGGWETGYDLPQKPVREQWLRYAAEAGFHWIYVHARFGSGELVRRARALGLRTMVYGLREPQELDAYGAQRPDGVITDHPLRWLRRGASRSAARPEGG